MRRFLLLMAITLLSAPAYAGEGLGYVNPGPMLAFVSSDEGDVIAPGFELSYMSFASNHAWDTGRGAFAQIFRYGDDDTRMALGLQGGSLIGGELGLAYRTAHGSYAGTPGAHLGLYLSFAVVTMSLRTSLALMKKDAGKPTSGNELAFVLGLKAPVHVHGSDRTFRFMGGG
jgi:hypothetical protein